MHGIHVQLTNNCFKMECSESCHFNLFQLHHLASTDVDINLVGETAIHLHVWIWHKSVASVTKYFLDHAVVWSTVIKEYINICTVAISNWDSASYDSSEGVYT